MLFKYFMIGAFALAATVMSTPTQLQGGSFITIQKGSYQKCLTTITQVKQPVVTNCQSGKVDKVKENLRKVYTPVTEVSTNFKSYTSIDKVVVVNQSYKFIDVLKNFEEVLIVIQSHPKISTKCNDVFAELNFRFESICTQFKHHGVNIHKSIKESSLTLSVWASLGFKFYISN